MLGTQKNGLCGMTQLYSNNDINNIVTADIYYPAQCDSNAHRHPNSSVLLSNT